VVQFGLVVEGEHPHWAVVGGVGAQHGVLGLFEGAAGAGGVLCRAVDGALAGQAEGREQGVAAGEAQVAGDVVGGERVGRPTHVPVHGPRVAPDAELDRLVSGHLGECLRLAHMRLGVVVAAAVDGGPHRRGAEGGCGGVEVAAYALGGAAGVLKVERFVGECGGPVLDAELAAVAVVAGDEIGEALLEAVDVAHADTARGGGAGSGCCGGSRRDAADEGTALHVGVLLLRWGWGGPSPAPWHEP
jgi:hypothetical protein